MTDSGDPVPAAIHALERALGVALIVQDIDPGPPASVVAIAMLDNQSTRLVGEGASEAEAWHDLAMALAAWKNVDPRHIRLFLGGF